MSIQKINLLGIQLTPYSSRQLLDFIDIAISAKVKKLILSGNIHSYNLAYEIPWLRDLFNRADAIRLDGEGVRLGAKILGYQTPHRMTWADFAWDLAEHAQAKRYSLYLLGARPGIADKAASALQQAYPNLQISGVHDGYFDKARDSKANHQVISQIKAANPDILLVGFGMPLQERWLKDNIDALQANIIMTCGAAFDYISGETPRGPHWMTSNGLEWVARLGTDPIRLWKRYIWGNPVFVYRVLRQKLGLLQVDYHQDFRKRVEDTIV